MSAGIAVDPVVELLDRHHQGVAAGHRVDRHEHDAAVVAPDERAGDLAVDDPGEHGGHGAGPYAPVRRVPTYSRDRDRTDRRPSGRPPGEVDTLLTIPNLFTLLRLLCLPLFLYLLLGRDNPAAAGVAARRARGHGLGRRLPRPPPRAGQRVRQEVRPDRRPPAVHRGARWRSSPPTPRRAGSASPSWPASCSSAAPSPSPPLFFSMARFDVTWLGKLATFLLMFAIPGFLIGWQRLPGPRPVPRGVVAHRHPWSDPVVVDRDPLHPADPRTACAVGRAARSDRDDGGVGPRVSIRLPPMNVPEQLRYSSDHEWVSRDGDVVRVGITDYAQDALGDVVFVQVPAVGDVVKAGDSFGEVESTKSVSDVYAPVAGTVVEVNEALGRRAAGAQRGSVRRRLDLHDPDERPGRARRAPRRRGLPGAHRGLSVAYVFCNHCGHRNPPDEHVLLELRLGARPQGRPHDHADGGRPVAGRAGRRRRRRGHRGRPADGRRRADRAQRRRRPAIASPWRPTRPGSGATPTARSCSTTSRCPGATPRSSRTAEGYVVTDAGSLNGTYVNQERIERAVLHHGDELQVGKFRLVLFERTDA